MNLNNQIKKYREQKGYSQEVLAEKIYVSRQTISNWETGKSYPDIHNILLLSTLFNVSLDELVKGDVEMMKRKISNKKLDQLAWVMIVFIGLAAISVGVIFNYLDDSMWLLLIPFCLWLVGMITALKLEKIKKKEDIKTYREIIAFYEGGDLAKIRGKRDKKKDFWEKNLIVIVFVLIVVVIMLLSIWLFS
ncbi:helix-turn-helix transcriptional regulator [Vagococcus hydrophili]|uniref:Helix-turn-helix transcriptional regulator n=1 Tax=Vagococcus hydrophili TaxID=2714947 RepID=A0A6G8ATA6_9ENTE|nr:helix-turn-helix transcriptional regulator [Vagococcus hydrophili]QIL48308.1 helix-turn-helix transcriptional regulator [Vagococcus hydrophili]